MFNVVYFLMILVKIIDPPTPTMACFGLSLIIISRNYAYLCDLMQYP